MPSQIERPDVSSDTAPPSSAAPGYGVAAGKVILFGEHAVVHGTPAIAAGISRGARSTASKSKHDHIQINGKALPDGHELYSALRNLRGVLGAHPARVEVELDIPAGAGLGASAAMAMATARALIARQGLSDSTRPFGAIGTSERKLFEAAQAWEKVFHGNPSGVDVAAAQRAGMIRFMRGQEPESLVIDKPLHLVIAQAGPPASTKSMVDSVAGFKSRNPVQFDRTVAAIFALVDNAQLLLRQGDWRAVGKLMDLNQMLLAGWMLSTEEIETACRLARGAGALGAKLTGAGGGGCVIALADDTTESPDGPGSTETILKVWKEAGLDCFSAVVGHQKESPQ